MKYILNKFLFAFAVAISVATTADAQFVIKVRPTAPVRARVIAPSSRHVWVNEDWAWQGNQYVYRGGYWALPPARYSAWVEGHWKQRRRGWVWIPGHWR